MWNVWLNGLRFIFIYVDIVCLGGNHWGTARSYQLILVIWKISKQIYQLIATILLIILYFTNIEQICFSRILPSFFLSFLNNIEFIKYLRSSMTFTQFIRRLIIFSQSSTIIKKKSSIDKLFNFHAFSFPLS